MMPETRRALEALVAQHGQRGTARLIGVSETAVRAWLRGSDPSDTTAHRIRELGRAEEHQIRELAAAIASDSSEEDVAAFGAHCRLGACSSRLGEACRSMCWGLSLEMHSLPYRGDAARAIVYVCARDVTERARSMKRLRLGEERVALEAWRAAEDACRQPPE